MSRDREFISWHHISFASQLLFLERELTISMIHNCLLDGTGWDKSWSTGQNIPWNFKLEGTSMGTSLTQLQYKGMWPYKMYLLLKSWKRDLRKEAWAKRTPHNVQSRRKWIMKMRRKSKNKTKQNVMKSPKQWMGRIGCYIK